MRKHVVLSAVIAGMLVAGMTALPVYSADDDSAKGSSFVQLYTGASYDYEWNDDAHRQLASSQCPIVTLTDDRKVTYPALTESLMELNKEKMATSEEIFKQNVSEAKSRLEADSDYQTVFSNEEEYYVLRQDKHIVSLLGKYSGYTGGAHGYYGYSTANFDTETGKRLKLSDCVIDGESFKSLVKEMVTTRYSDLEIKVVNEYFDETNLDDMVWTAGYEGITCYFDPYTLGPYAIGAQTILVPYAGNEKLFTDAVIDVPENFGIDIPLNERVQIGGRDIEIYGESTEYSSYDGVHILVNGEDYFFNDKIFAYGIRAMYLRTNGGEYLYLQYLEDNDYRLLDVFHLGDKAEHVGMTGLGKAGIYDEEQGFSATVTLPDPECMLLSTRNDLLGTTTARRIYRVGSDGLPDAVEKYYHFAGDRVLTAKMDMTLKEVDKDGNDIGTMQIVPGTNLTLYRTDDESIVDLKLDDGRIARVTVSDASFPHTIDDKDIEELFDGIMFAG